MDPDCRSMHRHLRSDVHTLVPRHVVGTPRQLLQQAIAAPNHPRTRNSQSRPLHAQLHCSLGRTTHGNTCQLGPASTAGINGRADQLLHIRVRRQRAILDKQRRALIHACYADRTSGPSRVQAVKDIEGGDRRACRGGQDSTPANQGQQYTRR